MTELLTREVPLILVLQPGTGDDAVSSSPLAGNIIAIIRHWPDGCRNRVGMAVGRGDMAVWIFPYKTDTFVALNDATPVISGMHEPVGKGEKLWMRAMNADALPHTVQATIIIEGIF